MGPRTYRELCASVDRVVWSLFIYSKRIKPLLKREVNNETFFTSLRSYYQIYYYTLLYAEHFLVLKMGILHEILTYINVYTSVKYVTAIKSLIFSFDLLEW